MSLPLFSTSRFVRSAVAGQGFFLGQLAWHRRPEAAQTFIRSFADDASNTSNASKSISTPSDVRNKPGAKGVDASLPAGWEDDANKNISNFSELPHRQFGFNQHMLINAEFKEALRQVLWQFRAPIRYAFAYGSGVFPQGPPSSTSSSSSSSKPSPHPNPPDAVTKWQTSGGKIIDFIFGVSYTEHWHSLNLQQHRDHYSFLGSFGSGIVSRVQDDIGAGAYFNPYVTVNGVTIKYGVVNLDTIYRDLSDWDTLYIAGRLQKPVKILRDDPRIRLANQLNLISALRTALLMLPEDFTERDLYIKIAGLSYMGDPRMALKAEDPAKVANIVDAQMANFRQLYLPLIDNLPNLNFNDPAVSRPGWIESADANCRLQQNMDPIRRGNMVRRLPKAFRKRLYTAYQTVFNMPGREFQSLMLQSKDEDDYSKRVGGAFERRIAGEANLARVVGDVVGKTVRWPTMSQSVKGLLTAGPVRSWQYWSEKREKGKARAAAAKAPRDTAAQQRSESSKEDK